MAKRKNRRIKKVSRGGTTGGVATNVALNPMLNAGISTVEYNPGWALPTATDTLDPRQAYSWLGPQNPVDPSAPRDVAGRSFDFPLGFNRKIIPRDDEPISFPELKALADNCSIIRLAIETRKDQMARLDWNIVPRDPDLNPDDPKFAARIEKLQNFFRCPDGDHEWHTWVRMLLEQVMVIDAATIYPQISRGGDLLALQIVDGATIKLVIDEWGRVPDAPYPAYQQVLKGVPVVNFTRDELIYRPRNVRVDKIYGYSPVEQIIRTANISIRREVFQLEYYTAGTDPQGFMEVPDGFTAAQIKEMQEYWDALMTDNMAQRRKIKFVGHGSKYTPVKEAVLTDLFDEWLARIVCFAFSIPPTAFTKQVNRATAESSAEIAEEEGLHPLMLWVEQTLDFIICKYFETDDLVFRWNTDQPLDALTKAQVDKINVENGLTTINEIRADAGKEPFPGADVPLIMTPTSTMLVSDIVSGKYGPDAVQQRTNDSADAASQRKITEAKSGVQQMLPTTNGNANEQNDKKPDNAENDKGKNNVEPNK